MSIVNEAPDPYQNQIVYWMAVKTWTKVPVLKMIYIFLRAMTWRMPVYTKRIELNQYIFKVHFWLSLSTHILWLWVFGNMPSGI